jgi:hypothetical protein
MGNRSTVSLDLTLDFPHNGPPGGVQISHHLEQVMRSNRVQTEERPKQFVPVPVVLPGGELILMAPSAVMGSELINPMIATPASRMVAAVS